MTTATVLPARLQAIVDDFAVCEGQEKLELLLQYAQQLPLLPTALQTKRDEMETVPECMTPVFFHAEIREAQVYFYLDVPEESPTVRGYASIIWQGLNGCTPAELLALPIDFYMGMGLQQVLSNQRLNGIRAILGRIKHYVQRLPNAATTS